MLTVDEMIEEFRKLWFNSLDAYLSDPMSNRGTRSWAERKRLMALSAATIYMREMQELEEMKRWLVGEE